VVRIERDLETSDLSEVCKLGLNVLWLHLFGNVSEEYIGMYHLILVWTHEVLVELKCSALLAFDLKVLHLLTGLTVLDRIFDVHNSRVEWSCDVFSDLRSCLKHDSRLLLEHHRKLG